MLEIRYISVSGLERAVMASGNPMRISAIDTTITPTTSDWERAYKLGKVTSGSGHDNFLTGITVVFDVKYPQYWSMEFQRYHFAQIVSSTSKMHRLVATAKTKNFKKQFNKYVDIEAIERIEYYIRQYEDTDEKYYYFMKALSNLPMGYELWMTVTTNYAQLKTIYNQRKGHKLREDWGVFCDMILSLPKFKELTGV